MKRALLPVSIVFGMISIGCAPGESPRCERPVKSENWRQIVRDEDRKRLREWRSAWTEALTKARGSGHGGEIDAEKGLLNPDGALPWSAPPPGLYSCRTIKLGAQAEGMPDYVVYPAFDCSISSDTSGPTRLVKLTGSQRPVGRLLPYQPERMVFLGTLQLGDESRALRYGRDHSRDLAGILEQIGDRQWRVVFPYPHFESTLDVLELVPKG